MRTHQLIFGLLGLLTAFTAAWSAEDREIFRIRAELQEFEGDSETTFYDLLGIKPSASIDEITKAYRTITRSLHPDKIKQTLRAQRAREGSNPDGSKKKPSQKEVNQAVKLAGDRQARLSLVRNILSGPERDRYDHFLKNGFPTWKGTNYYYQRYRPGLGTVLASLFLVAGGGVHYVFLWLSHKRQREFVQRYIKFARDSAWGDNLTIPGIDDTPAPAPAPTPAQDDDAAPAQPVNRRQRRFEERAARKEKGGKVKGKNGGGSGPTSGVATPRETAQAGPTGARKRVIAENGKILVVDVAGNVYLEEEDEEGNQQQFLLDPTELKPPSFADTAVVRLPIFMIRSTFGRIFGSKNVEDDASLDAESVEVDSDNEQIQHTPSGSTDSAAEDFELLEKSTDSLRKAKASGAQTGGKASKRKSNKKR